MDHSIAQLHALRGTITDDEIAEHPDQNKLFAQVGGPTAPEAEIKRWDLSEGRWFVLCSDGFWEIFRHDEIVELFMSDDREAELKGRFERKLRATQAPRQHHGNPGGSDSGGGGSGRVSAPRTRLLRMCAPETWLLRANLRQRRLRPKFLPPAAVAAENKPDQPVRP